MGGSIRVIVREENGKVHKMTRWTNQLPYIVKNPKFYKSDKEWLDQYIEGAKNSDYNQGEQYLAPEDYGIVVLDYMKKKILSSQCYCGFLEFNDSALSMDKDRLERKKNPDKNDALACMDGSGTVTQEDLDWNYYKSARLLMDDGNLIIREFTYDRDDYENTLKETEDFNLSLDEAIKKSNKGLMSIIGSSIKNTLNGKKMDVRYTFEIDYDKLGWTCIDIDDNAENLVEIFKHMYVDGFEFTKEDLEEYQKDLDYRAQDCETDEEEEYIRSALKRIIREDKLNVVLS